VKFGKDLAKADLGDKDGAKAKAKSGKKAT
jgi:hypothetical protein